MANAIDGGIMALQRKLRDANESLRQEIANCKSVPELRKLIVRVNQFKKQTGEDDNIISRDEQQRIFVDDRSIQLIKMQVRNAVAAVLRHVPKDAA